MKKIALLLTVVLLIPSISYALTAEENRERAERLRQETERIQRSQQPRQQIQTQQEQKPCVEDFMAMIANKLLCNMVDDLKRDPIGSVNGFLNWSKDYERQQQDDEIRRNILREQNQRRIDETFPHHR